MESELLGDPFAPLEECFIVRVEPTQIGIHHFSRIVAILVGGEQDDSSIGNVLRVFVVIFGLFPHCFLISIFLGKFIPFFGKEIFVHPG